MPTLNTYFNWGNSLYNSNPELTRQLDEAYNDTAQAVNTKVSKYFTDGVKKPHTDPPSNSQFNMNFDICDIYVRSDNNKVWVLTSRTTSQAVTWTLVS